MCEKCVKLKAMSWGVILFGGFKIGQVFVRLLTLCKEASLLLCRQLKLFDDFDRSLFAEFPLEKLRQ
jgi:hypothetical protein